MSYYVTVKRETSSTAEMYFQGCEKTFQSLRKAREYFLQFEDWEQGMLEIVNCTDNEIPF